MPRILTILSGHHKYKGPLSNRQHGHFIFLWFIFVVLFLDFGTHAFVWGDGNTRGMRGGSVVTVSGAMLRGSYEFNAVRLLDPSVRIRSEDVSEYYMILSFSAEF